MWSQEVSGGPMSWTRLSHLRGRGLTRGRSTKTLLATWLVQGPKAGLSFGWQGSSRAWWWCGCGWARGLPTGRAVLSSGSGAAQQLRREEMWSRELGLCGDPASMPGSRGRVAAAQPSVAQGVRWGCWREGQSGREEAGHDWAARDCASTESFHVPTKPTSPTARVLPQFYFFMVNCNSAILKIQLNHMLCY